MIVSDHEIKRFYSHVKITEGCHLWQSATQWGYGIFTGYREGRHLTFKAHRFAWRIKHGKWPTECVLHHCDVRNCVNPEHLFEGTKGDNSRDRDQKGRQAKGEKQGSSKLTEKQARQIIHLKGKFTLKEVGDYFGIHLAGVSKIQRGITWKHLQPKED